MSNLDLKPQSGNLPKKLVVFLHGYGSDGADMIGLAPYFAKSLPDFHFYAPDGIEFCEMGGFGYQWYSFKSRDPQDLVKEVARVVPPVLDIIEAKLTELKLTFEDLIIIGFSQGTMLGLYLTHFVDFPIAGLVGYSGAFLPPETPKNNGTPICLIHGRDDEVVAFSSLEQAVQRLEKLGVKTVETHEIKNLGHSIDLSGLKYAVNFINKHVK